MDITLQAGQTQALRCKAPQGKGRAQKSEPGGGRSKQCLQNRKITEKMPLACFLFFFFFLFLKNQHESCRHFNFLSNKEAPQGVSARDFLSYTLCYLEQLENTEQKVTPDMSQPDFMVFDRKVRQGVNKTIVCRCLTQAQHYTVLRAQYNAEHFLGNLLSSLGFYLLFFCDNFQDFR